MRKLLDLIFSQHDLAWLDDILPDKDKKKKEDDKTKKKERKAVEPESDEEVREIWTNMKLNSSLPSTHTHTETHTDTVFSKVGECGSHFMVLTVY